MEDTINKIIELDNLAKSKISTVQEKKENIENYINERLKKEKETIDNQYAYKKKKLQEKYDIKFEEEKNILDEKQNRELTRIQEKYENEKQLILKKLLDSII